MKVQVFLPATIAVSLLLAGIIKVRQGEREKEYKLSMFGDVKLRVSNDVLREYQSEGSEAQNDLDITTGKHKTLEEEIKEKQMASEKSKSQVEACGGEKVGGPCEEREYEWT